MNIKSWATRAVVLLAPFLIALPAFAATDRAVVTGFTDVGPYIGASTVFMDSSTNALTSQANLYVPPASSDSQADIVSSTAAAIAAYASSNGWPVTSVVWPWSEQTDIAAAIASSSPKAWSFAYPTRAVNTAYQAATSTTNGTFVSAGVNVATTLSLSGGSQGTVTLEYADNSGMTTNLHTVQASTNGNTGTLTLGLNISQTVTASVSGIIPTGKYWEILTTNVTGTPTYAIASDQEIAM